MLFNHSASNCMKSLIICSKSAEVTSKQCLGVILMSLFFYKAFFQSYAFRWKKDLLKFFLNLFINKWKIWWMLSPRKIPCPKKFLVMCLWNMFTSLVISFLYLTNHSANILTKLYTYSISPVQSQHNNIKTTLHKVLF